MNPLRPGGRDPVEQKGGVEAGLERLPFGDLCADRLRGTPRLRARNGDRELSSAEGPGFARVGEVQPDGHRRGLAAGYEVHAL